MKKLTAYTLATLTKDLDVMIQGDPECLIQGVSAIQEGEPGTISFLTNTLYKKYLAHTKASAVILSPEDVKECKTNAVVTSHPYFVYAQIACFFEEQPDKAPGTIHPTAVIEEGSEIDPTVRIGPYCVIGKRVKLAAHVVLEAGCIIKDEVAIGERTILEARVILYERVRIGKKVKIASGTVVGSDGFGYAPYEGKWHKVPQLGSVVIADEVEIGANCCIDRGAIGDTFIGKGTKLDNLIQIGHNARVGEHTVIAGCVGIAGSAVVGNHCLIGGQAGVNGHVQIADGVAITGGTAVTKSIRERGVYSSGVGGLMTNVEWRKLSARVHRLDQMGQRLKKLEAILKIHPPESEVT